MRISDWSSDVCSSDLIGEPRPVLAARKDRGVVCRIIGDRKLGPAQAGGLDGGKRILDVLKRDQHRLAISGKRCFLLRGADVDLLADAPAVEERGGDGGEEPRSEEHTSELQSLMRISYAVFCLKKKTT